MRKFCILFMSLLASCTVGPDYQNQDVFEDKQIAQSLQLTGNSLKVSPKWYQNFHEPNLDILIEEALKKNTDVLTAMASLKQARTAAKIARVQFLPMFGAKFGYDYLKTSDNIGLTSDSDYFSIGFDANWELDIWGKGRRLNEQKKAAFESAFYSLRHIKNITTAEVANTYFSLKTLEEKRRITRQNIKLQEDIFQTIFEKYQAGIADEGTYHQSHYLLEKTKALIPQIEAEIKAYENALYILCGDLPQNNKDAFKTTKNPVQKTFSYPMKMLFELPNSIIRTRPDVKAVEKELIGQNAAIGYAVANLYPNVSLSALLGFSANNMSDLFNSSSKVYQYNPAFVAPIFQWGQLQNAVRLEREKKEAAYQNYRKTLLNSIEELSNAMVNVQQEYQANKSLKNAAYNMQKTYRAMKEKYDNGLIEYATLLEVQQDLLQSEMAAVESNGALYKKIIAFYKATGGGYNDTK